MKKICTLTGTRAEYDLLRPVMREIKNSQSLSLQLIVTGTHLCPEYGETYKAIEEDGFNIDKKIEIILSSDSSIGVAKSMGLGTISLAEAYQELSPDYLLILGDRFELLAAAQAALISKIPIIHMCGGDVTEGAYDDSIRHSITKMSHLHFVTNKDSWRRVCQLGENPTHVYNVGHVALDEIQQFIPVSKKDLEKKLNVKLLKKVFLITFHPETHDTTKQEIKVKELLNALKSFNDNDTTFVFTYANADQEGRSIMAQINEFVQEIGNSFVYKSLGQRLYWDFMANSNVVIGNSSSGVYEAPSFKIPTVNIGDREKGRIYASSVINSIANCTDIINAIHQALILDCSNTINLYGNGTAVRQIMKILENVPILNSKKTFFEIE